MDDPALPSFRIANSLQPIPPSFAGSNPVGQVLSANLAAWKGKMITLKPKSAKAKKKTAGDAVCFLRLFLVKITIRGIIFIMPRDIP